MRQAARKGRGIGLSTAIQRACIAQPSKQREKSHSEQNGLGDAQIILYVVCSNAADLQAFAAPSLPSALGPHHCTGCVAQMLLYLLHSTLRTGIGHKQEGLCGRANKCLRPWLDRGVVHQGGRRVCSFTTPASHAACKCRAGNKCAMRTMQPLSVPRFGYLSPPPQALAASIAQLVCHAGTGCCKYGLHPNASCHPSRQAELQTWLFVHAFGAF